MTQLQAALVKALSKMSASDIDAILAKSGKTVSKTSAKPKNEVLAAKDARLIRAFARKGIKNVVLMDRSDKSKPFNVRPFGRPAKDGQPATGWISVGRIVKKGEHGVQGLFHEDQTEELTAKPE